VNIQIVLNHIGSVLNLLKVLILSRPNRVNKTPGINSIVILGNGPSLQNILNLNILKNDTLLAVNKFYSSVYFYILKPKHYVIAAPEFWIPLEDESYISMQKELRESFRKVNWEMNFYIPEKAKKYKLKEEVTILNPAINTIYYNDVGLDSYNSLDKWMMKKKLAMPRPHNVLIPSLMIAIWIGAREIKIYGADHSWLPMIKVLDNNDVVISQNHFYDTKKQDYKPMRKLGVGQRKLHEVIYKFYLAFRGYHYIQAFALEKGVRILNCTPGSFIDAFERSKKEFAATE